MVPFPLDLVFIYAIYYDSGFMSFFVISASYCLFFVLEISLMQSNSVVISFDCIRFFLFIFCEMWLKESAYADYVDISLERVREYREKKRIEHHRMAFGRLVFDRLCVGRLYCVVSCVHYEKLLLFVIIFYVRSIIRSPQRLADCLSCFWYQ